MAYRSYIQAITANNPDMPRSQRRALASLGDFAVSEGVDSSMYESPDQMLEDLQDRQRRLLAAQQAQRAQQPAAPRPRPQVQQVDEEPSMFSPFQQYASLTGMNNNIMRAFDAENDSRVAQSREWRRMQHEMALAEMRAQIEREKNALQQYQVDSDAASQIRQLKLQNYLAKQKMGMPATKTMVNGRWVEDWEL